MENDEARVIDEAIKFIQMTQGTGMCPKKLEAAVEDYLAAHDETLETY